MNYFIFRSIILSILLFGVFSFLSSARAVTIRTLSTSGNWGTASNWSPSGIPASTDSVVIPSALTVDVNIPDALCGSLNVQGTLNILPTGSLIVNKVTQIDQGRIYVGDGFLFIKGDTHIIGNGNANQGILSVINGTIIVGEDIVFWKDYINGKDVGSEAYRLLDVTGAGTVTLGGTLVNPSGTTPQTLTKTTTGSFIFKGGLNNECWCEPANWTKRDGFPGSADSVIIPFNLKVRITSNQSVKQLDLYKGAEVDFGSQTLTVTGDINNKEGILTGTTGWLKFDGTTVNQTYTSNLPVTVPNIEINKAGRSLLLNGEIKISDQLKVASGTLNSNGKLTLLSTANKSANIGPLLNGADIIGNVNVQVFMTGGYRGYRLLSSPITDAALTEKTFKQLQKYIIITGPGGTAAGFDQGGSAQPEALTLHLYNEVTGATQSSITPIRNIADPIAAGRGFYAFFRGKQMGSYQLNSPKLNAPFDIPEDVTVTYTGPINKFSQAAVPLSNSQQSGDTWNGYNLVGNPYPSTIDYEKIPRGSAISDQLVTLKPNGSAASYKQELKVSNNGGTQYIQPGQAFFLVAGANSSVSFEETHKASSIHSSGFLTAPKETLEMTAGGNSTKNELFQMIRLNLQDNLNTDEATIVFQEGRSANADFDDVLYFSGSSVSLSSISADRKKLAINIMPAVKEIKEIKLSVNSTSSGLLKLNFSDLSGAEGYQVLLKDALLPDSLVNVKIRPIYAFNIDKANYDTYGNDRFSLIFKPEPIAAPFLFTADREKSNVELNWVSNIATEINYFEVEVSTDRVVYLTIGKIKNAGNAQKNSQYSFLDKSPPAGIRFYRLKQFNKDGSVTYTDMRMVDLLSSDSDVKISLYPNPALDKIQVSIPRRPAGIIDAVVFNRLGQPVQNISFSASDEITFNLANWTKGIYFLELRSSGTKALIGHSKFVVGH